MRESNYGGNDKIRCGYRKWILDAYLEEELYDLFTYCIQNPAASDFEIKKQRVKEIGRDLHEDGGSDAMENMFYSLEIRIKEEIGKDVKPYRLWWNGMDEDWKY
jgi:hypothetical protein